MKLQQKDIETLYDMCQTAHKRITLQDNRITELETTNVAVQEVAVQKTTTVEVMEPPKKRQRKRPRNVLYNKKFKMKMDKEIIRAGTTRQTCRGTPCLAPRSGTTPERLPSMAFWRTVASGTSLGTIALRTGPSMASGTKP